MKDRLILILKGIWIGATMMIPGVSASMAMALGVYDRMIHAVNDLRKHFLQNLITLLLFGSGILMGITLFSIPISAVLRWFPRLTLYFFIGAVCGGVPMMLKEAKIKRWDFSVFFYFFVGLVVAWGLRKLPEGMFTIGGTASFSVEILLIVAGILIAIALVLPGINMSYMLLVLGLYEIVIEAIKNRKFLLLLPLAVGMMLGIVGTIRIMEHLIKRFPTAIYLMVLGFIAGSVVDIFPGISLSLLMPAILLFTFGFLFIYFISLMGASCQDTPS